MENEIQTEEELVRHCKKITNNADEWKTAISKLAAFDILSFTVRKNPPAISEDGVVVCTIGLPVLNLPEICILLGPKKNESTAMDAGDCDRAVDGAKKYLCDVVSKKRPAPQSNDVVTIEGVGEFFFLDSKVIEDKDGDRLKKMINTFKHTIAGLGSIDFDRLFAVRALSEVEHKNTLN